MHRRSLSKKVRHAELHHDLEQSTAQSRHVHIHARLVTLLTHNIVVFAIVASAGDAFSTVCHAPHKRHRTKCLPSCMRHLRVSKHRLSARFLSAVFSNDLGTQWSSVGAKTLARSEADSRVSVCVHRRHLLLFYHNHKPRC